MNTNIINWLECIWKADLPANAKYLAAYLRTFMNDKRDVAWPSYVRMVDETGLSRATISKYLEVLQSKGWLQRKRGGGRTNTQYHAVICTENLIEMGILSSSTAKLLDPKEFRSCTAAVQQLNGCSSAAKREYTIEYTNKYISGKFKPPTVKEVTDYCSKRGNGIDAEKFVDHYQTNGWMRGKNKIKDWKACVRTWEKNSSPANGISMEDLAQ